MGSTAPSIGRPSQKIFPDDHAALVTKYGDEASLHLAAERSSALCGTNYRPYADGPGMMIEILVGEEWQANKHFTFHARLYIGSSTAPRGAPRVEKSVRRTCVLGKVKSSL